MEKIQLNPKWRPLFTSDDQYYLLTGGRGSGKSFALSYFALSLISLQSNHRIAVYRATMVSVEDSIMKDMKDLVQRLPNAVEFEVLHKKIVNKRTGSEIFFKGLQTNRLSNTAYLKGLSNCTTFILDEAEELENEKDWDKIDDTFRTTLHQIRMIISLNPATREHWIYKRFIIGNKWEESTCGSKDDITYIHTTYKDNKHNSPKKVAKWERAKTERPEYYKHTIMGGWMNAAEGVIFEKDVNWVEGKYQLTDRFPRIGCDPGHTDETAIVECSFDMKPFIGGENDWQGNPNPGAPGRAYKGKIYVKQHCYESGLTEHDIVKKLQEVSILKDRWGDVVQLSCIIDEQDASLISACLRARPSLSARKCPKGPGSVLRGIMMLKDYLLVIDPSSTEVKIALNNHIWDDKKHNIPKNEYKHGPDAIRYAAMVELASKRSSDISRVTRRF